MNGTRKVLLGMCWYNQDVRIGVAKYAYEHNWDLVVNQSWPVNYHQTDTDFDGLLTQYDTDKAYWSHVMQLPIPKLSICHVPTDEIPSVEADDHALSLLAAEFLLKLGFTQFLCFSPKHGYHTHRMATFADKVRAHQGTVAHIPFVEGLTHHKNYPQAHIIAQLEKAKKPVAVFVANDEHAWPIIQAAKQLALNVPKDVAIIGTDNDTSYCETLPISLTSVDQAAQQQGYEAARTLDRLMSGQKVEWRQLIKPTKVIARKSTDIYLFEDKTFPQAIYYIHNHFSQNISVEHVADYCNVCTRKLYQVFKRELGKTPREVIVEKRIKRSKEMLVETNDSLREIAEKCGFVTNHNLYVSYKRTDGISPSQYRAQQRNSRQTNRPHPSSEQA